MKKIGILILLITTSQAIQAQTKIKDGTIISSLLPDPNAILELESNNKGFLLPRLALDSTGLATPLTAHIAGMTVYNTATNADVTPGYYYNNGTQWVKLGGDSNDAWMLQGNAGTHHDTNFIGTTDSVAFVIKTNNNIKAVS